MAYNIIMLKNCENNPSEERAAGEAGIKPGHFLEFTNTLTFNLQDESDTIGPKLMADIDPMRPASAGSNTTMAITDSYTNGDRVKAKWLLPGSVVYALLAKGHSVTKGDYLAFAGFEEPGCVGAVEYSSAVKGGGIIAMALETVNNSAGTSGARIMIQII